MRFRKDTRQIPPLTGREGRGVPGLGDDQVVVQLDAGGLGRLQKSLRQLEIESRPSTEPVRVMLKEENGVEEDGPLAQVLVDQAAEPTGEGTPGMAEEDQDPFSRGSPIAKQLQEPTS